MIGQYHMTAADLHGNQLADAQASRAHDTVRPWKRRVIAELLARKPVSYTHLTLPTICSV
eukprot:1916363-Alexandrium_andersonii.AAC.1